MDFSYTCDGVRIVDNDFVALIGGDQIPLLQRAIDGYHERCRYFLRLDLVKEYWKRHNLPGGVKFDLRDDWFHVDMSSELFGELTPLLMDEGICFECHYKDKFPSMRVHLGQFLDYMGVEL